MIGSLIEENVKKIREEISALSNGGAVRLLAATKTRSAEEIQAAYDAGIDAAGENARRSFQKSFWLVSMESMTYTLLDICRPIR